MNRVDFLVVGHICRDLVPSGHRLGGTAVYASITARNLGLRAGVLTRASDPMSEDPLLDGIEVCVLPSSATTTFRNIYRDGRRIQQLIEVGDPISLGDVPPEWLAPQIALLGPIAHEVDPRLVRAFQDSLTGLTPQGWLRSWDERGMVYGGAKMADLATVSSGAQVVVLSEEDMAGDRCMVNELIEHVPVVIVTAGYHGATMHQGGCSWYIPSQQVREVDPTGAGDVFAAAFLIRLAETDDPVGAAEFASVAASLSVEHPGTEGIPERHQIMTRLPKPRETPEAQDGNDP